MSSDENEDFFRKSKRQKKRREDNRQMSTYVLTQEENDQDDQDDQDDSDSTTDSDMVECSLSDDQVPLCNSECSSSNFGYASSTDNNTNDTDIFAKGNRRSSSVSRSSSSGEDDDDNSLSFKNIFTHGELPLGQAERIRFALIWGINLAQQDFEKYFLYFLLTRISDPPCDYVSVYSLWILIASIIAYPVNVLSGWLTDYVSKFQNHVLQISLVLQTLFFLAMFYMLLKGEALWAQVFYQIRQAAMVQSMTSTWKLIKIRLDVEIQRSWARYPSSVKVGRLLDTENVVVSGIGNMGDLVSGIVEVVALVVFYALTKLLTVHDIGVGLFITAASLNIIPLLLSLTITRKELIPPSQEGYSYIPDEATSTATSLNNSVNEIPIVSAAAASGNDIGNEVKIEGTQFLLNSRDSPSPSSNMPANYGATSNQHFNRSNASGDSFGSRTSGSLGYYSSSGSSYGGLGIEDELGAQILADDDFVAPEPEYYGKHGTGKLRSAWEWLKKRLRYIVTTRAVINAMCHSILVTFLYYFMTYPVTVLINTEDDVVVDLSSESNYSRVSNYCHNTLVNLLRQGAILMVCYSVLSSVYMAFLVRCPPRIYYTFVLHFLSLLTALSLVIILLLKKSIKKYILNFVISIAQIIPYYINSYTYYVLNTSIRQDYYGFVQALYAFCIQAILISTNFSLYYSVPNVILVSVCLMLIVFVSLHGFLMRSIFLNPDWAEEAKKI